MPKQQLELTFTGLTSLLYRWYFSPQTNNAELHSLYAKVSYGSDFLGIPEIVYMTPTLDKYHMVLLQGLAKGTTLVILVLHGADIAFVRWWPWLHANSLACWQ